MNETESKGIELHPNGKYYDSEMRRVLPISAEIPKRAWNVANVQKFVPYQWWIHISDKIVLQHKIRDEGPKRYLLIRERPANTAPPRFFIWYNEGTYRKTRMKWNTIDLRSYGTDICTYFLNYIDMDQNEKPVIYCHYSALPYMLELPRDFCKEVVSIADPRIMADRIEDYADNTFDLIKAKLIREGAHILRNSFE